MIGTVLRVRYEVTQEVSEGPIFHLFRAFDRNKGQDVWLRLLKPPFGQEASFVSRLKEVVGGAQGAQHPHLERLIGVDDQDSVPFIVSEASSGQTLQDRIKKLAPFSAQTSIGYVISVCEALKALHQGGIVHGDIRSSNVFVGVDGKVRLTGAALWQAYSASGSAGLVALPLMAPSLAPEITAGSMPNAQSDLYAVGILLYELLTGKVPFSGDTMVAVAMKHGTAPVPSVRAINPSVPTVLEEIVRKALSKPTSDRYETVDHLLHDLKAVQDALRFGKSLSWPIPNSSAEHAEVVAITKPDEETRKKIEKQAKVRTQKEKREPNPDRVPRFIAWLAYLALLCIVVVICAFAYFNFSKPKLVNVPNIVGMSEVDAIGRLKQSHLGMQVKRVYNEQFAEGKVIETNPRAGQKAREGSPIQTVIARGSRYVAVPDLTGKKLEEAKSLLKGMGLEVNPTIDTVESSKFGKGKIVSFSPPAGKKVERGSIIRLQVSGSENPEKPPATEDRRAYQYTLSITMPEGGDPVKVRIDMQDAEVTKTIYEAVRDPGDFFEAKAEGIGPKVKFKVFFDGQLVKEQEARAGEDSQN